MPAESAKKPCVFTKCGGTMTFSATSTPSGYGVDSGQSEPQRDLQPGWTCSWNPTLGRRHWVPEPDDDAEVLGLKRLHEDKNAAEIWRAPNGIFEVHILKEGWQPVTDIVGGSEDDACRRVDAKMGVDHDPKAWFPITHESPED